MYARMGVVHDFVMRENMWVELVLPLDFSWNADVFTLLVSQWKLVYSFLFKKNSGYEREGAKKSFEISDLWHSFESGAQDSKINNGVPPERKTGVASLVVGVADVTNYDGYLKDWRLFDILT